MSEPNYLLWLSKETKSSWWHDSAIPDEIESAIENGALGVTTNPVLTYRTLQARPAYWKDLITGIHGNLEPDAQAEAFLRVIAGHVAGKLEHIYNSSGHIHGFACGQLDPTKAGDETGMIAMAERVVRWAPNMAVKLPSTASGLRVIEKLASEGHSVCATVNFTVAQALAVAESFERGVRKARDEGIEPGICLAVQQVGRLDDYLRETAMDRNIQLEENVITMAGIAVAKRAYALFKERKYSAKIMPAGLRGTYHVTELAGSDIVFSIHPFIQQMIIRENPVRHEKGEEPLEPRIIDALMRLPEFVKAYEPGGLTPEEFITFGVAQRTLSQFAETGWYPLQTFGMDNVSLRWK